MEDRPPTGFERVLVEFDWYDGPRAGIAEVDGTPHYFATDEYTESPDQATYKTWPVRNELLGLELEVWRIFVAWNKRYEQGLATVATHPGQGNVDARYDELETLLAPERLAPPDAVLRRAEWQGKKTGKRYDPDPSCWVRWGRSDR